VPGNRHAWLLRIHPVLDGDRLAVYPFEGARITLGRAPTCTIAVDLPGISSQHCRLERSRTGGRLRVVDLESRNGTQVNGWKVPAKGADCSEGSLLRIGEALFVYRELTDEEAEAAALPPLPGPVNTRHAPLVKAIQRVQTKVTGGGPVWLCGPPGCGRSVLENHLRTLQADRLGSAWITGGELDYRLSDEVPEGADPERTVVFPALRDRVEDVLVLAGALCSPRKAPFGPRLLEALHLYDWPGNIRELRIMLERAFHPAWGPMPGMKWDIELFPDIRHYLERRPRPSGRVIGRSEALTEPGATIVPPELSARELRERLEANRWKLFPTAQQLGISRAALVAALARVGLRGPAYGHPGDGTGIRVPPGLTPRQR
jgi:hypothetical protein